MKEKKNPSAFFAYVFVFVRFQNWRLFSFFFFGACEEIESALCTLFWSFLTWDKKFWTNLLDPYIGLEMFSFMATIAFFREIWIYPWKNRQSCV